MKNIQELLNAAFQKTTPKIDSTNFTIYAQEERGQQLIRVKFKNSELAQSASQAIKETFGITGQTRSGQKALRGNKDAFTLHTGNLQSIISKLEVSDSTPSPDQLIKDFVTSVDSNPKLRLRWIGRGVNNGQNQQKERNAGDDITTSLNKTLTEYLNLSHTINGRDGKCVIPSNGVVRGEVQEHERGNKKMFMLSNELTPHQVKDISIILQPVYSKILPAGTEVPLPDLPKNDLYHQLESGSLYLKTEYSPKEIHPEFLYSLNSKEYNDFIEALDKKISELKQQSPKHHQQQPKSTQASELPPIARPAPVVPHFEKTISPLASKQPRSLRPSPRNSKPTPTPAVNLGKTQEQPKRQTSPDIFNQPITQSITQKIVPTPISKKAAPVLEKQLEPKVTMAQTKEAANFFIEKIANPAFHKLGVAFSLGSIMSHQQAHFLKRGEVAFQVTTTSTADKKDFNADKSHFEMGKPLLDQTAQDNELSTKISFNTLEGTNKTFVVINQKDLVTWHQAQKRASLTETVATVKSVANKPAPTPSLAALDRKCPPKKTPPPTQTVGWKAAEDARVATKQIAKLEGKGTPPQR